MDVYESYKTAQKAGWAHFAPLQAITTIPAARLVKHARISPGSIVVDVACGTGVVAITAARRGAQVTGLDLTPELLEAARANAATAGVNISWHEGDVEDLPFESSTFDAVVSQFGHMFAPRPAVAIGEMLRVLKPGGTLAFSTWPPELCTGRMFGLVAKYMPPMPSDIAPPVAWGEVNVIRERLGSAVPGSCLRSRVSPQSVAQSAASSASHRASGRARTDDRGVAVLERSRQACGVQARVRRIGD